MKIWLFGMSIYPLSWSISIAFKSLSGKANIFEVPGSDLGLFIVIWWDSLLHLFGTSITQLNQVVFDIIFLLILISVNAICLFS